MVINKIELIQILVHWLMHRNVKPNNNEKYQRAFNGAYKSFGAAQK